ncbi:MAG: amidohydrolase family protein [Acidobacteriaceae bacterium]|jgi:predicted TIM-barrel fold metal-dependent hydrolase|nr:amidohydrolase family protein [Acidobacteriaceae bacterium]
MLTRRRFLAASAAAPLLAQSPWPSPVIDIHLHPRRDSVSSLDHVTGAGMEKAVLLTHIRDAARAKEQIAKHPGRFTWFVAADPAQPGGFDGVAQALKDGAIGIGEMKTHTRADAKAMRRLYDLAADHRVPVLLHFQQAAPFDPEALWNTGFPDFHKILQAHKKTNFIGHANFFWASISANPPSGEEYPAGPVQTSGLTDRWLADYPNLFGDLSANSGNNALSRDPAFARAFLARHQNKLMFGSDCSCKDGIGTGGSTLLARLKGKCVGRDTLSLLRELTSPDVFRKVCWGNAHLLLRVSA